MLLGNKKTQGNEQNWCVVLSPLRNEIDKKKIAERISKVFFLSPEESLDLVANTPIILLDSLTRNVAAKVKDYFHSAGAEMILTNDVFLKRKCYRTVWPEPPSLAFLHDWPKPDAFPSPAFREEPLAPEEAMNEIKSLSKNETKDFSASVVSVPVFSSPAREGLAGELERLRKECAMLRGQSERLREELAERVRESETRPAAEPALGARLQEREKEARELRALLNNADERYEVLKEEYRQARKIFEEKLSLASQENEKWKEKVNEISEHREILQKEKEALAKALEERQKASEKSQLRLIEELELRSREARQWESRFQEVEKTILELRESLAGQEKIIAANLRQLEGRERELENARRQLREVNVSLEQRAVIQKKTQLAGQLVEKEVLLKGLVKDQERFESEIREREEAIRGILTEQEKVEKEIIEARQAQRHLLEQEKREKSGKLIRPAEETPENHDSA